MAIALGCIPWRRGRKSDGGYLTPASILHGARVGACPGCFDHWKGNDTVFTNPVLWYCDAEGVKIVHALAESNAAELAVINAIRRGIPMYFSYGWPRTPEALRAATARWERRNAGKVIEWREYELTHESFGHWSYGVAGNFDQEPIELL